MGVTPPSALYPDPKTLYDPDPEIVPSMLVTHGAPVAGASLGIAAHAWYNYYRRRPYYASFLMYIPWSVGLAGAFMYLNSAFKRYYSRRDTIHKHYIMLHPEDFPPPPKVKIGDIFEDWRPVR